MGANDLDRIEASSALFTRAIREVRASPARFAAGLALIAERFSTTARQAEAQAHLDDIAERGMAGRPLPPHVVELYQHNRASASEAMARVGALRGFVETRTIAMDRAEAQAVLLVIAWIADDEPDFTQGLPRLLMEWVAEHWAGRTDPDREERIESQRGLLTFLRHGFGHDERMRSVMAHVGQLAWDRMEAAGATVVDREPLSEAAKAVYEILCALPDTKGLSAKELVQVLARPKPPIIVDEQRIKGSIRSELLSRGLKNERRGYFIPVSQRPPKPT